jgi:hypothetical protein
MLDGTTRRLTDIPWTQASAGYAQVSTERSPSGGRLSVDGNPVPYGIGANARSFIEYALPEGAVRFEAKGAIDDGALGQATGATVQFSVHALPAAVPADPAGVPVPVTLAELGLGGRWRVRDLWLGQDLAPVEGSLAPVVAWHGATLYRLSPAR